MRLDDLLRVMREEFAQAADHVDELAASWLGEAAVALPGTAGAGMAHAERLCAELQRLAETARVVSLNGLASVLHHVAASASAMAVMDDTVTGPGLTWLAGWRAPLAACFDAPGAAGPADALLAWLAEGPMALDAPTLAALRGDLVSPPVLPGVAGGAGDEEAAALPPATDDDVSLAVPEDVDRDLYDTFLADAPRQMERLADMVRALVHGELDHAALLEAQRAAHTFKGSGNIVGVRGVGRLAHRIEDLLEFAAARPDHRLPAAMGRDLEQASATLEQMIYALRGEEAPPHDARAQLQRLLDWINAIRDGSWAEREVAGAAAEAPLDLALDFAQAAERAVGIPVGKRVVAGVAAVADEADAADAAHTPHFAGAAPADSLDLDLGAAADAIRPEAAEASPPATAPPKEAPKPLQAGMPAELEPELRVPVSRLERLVRRAGQGLVQGTRLNEHLRALEGRLLAWEANSRALQQRVAELQAALDRQGVLLRGKPASAGSAVAVVAPAQTGVDIPLGDEAIAAQFDPLELDRYNQLHTLARFVAEMAADELELHQAARDDAHRAQAALRDHTVALKEQHRELLAARLLPFKHITSRLKRTVSQTAAVLNRRAQLVIEGDAVQMDSDVLERLTEPLLHLLRNAVDHGIEPPEQRQRSGKPEVGTVTLSLRRDGQTVRIECRDDGRGIDLDAVRRRALALGLVSPEGLQGDAAPERLARIVLLPGFSTRDEVTEVSGRGVGMDVVAERVRAMKGHLDIRTEAQRGTTITLRVPATMGAAHALLVQAGGDVFGLPTETVLRAVPAGEGHWSEGGFQLGRTTYRHARLADWLGLPDSGRPAAERPVVLVHVAAAALSANGVADGTPVVALSVDAVVDARELILQDVGGLLARARGVLGGAVRPDGRPLFLLDPERLAGGVGSAAGLDGAMGTQAVAALRQRATVQRKRVLVVDDAISVRKAVAQVLADAGYEAELARDGFDAWQRLSADAAGTSGGASGVPGARGRIDLVITDLEMPNLNGLDLVRHVRRAEAGRWAAADAPRSVPESAPEHAADGDLAKPALPMIMITSRATEKHREAALAAGVSRYLTKPYTDAELLAEVRRLLAA